MARIVHQPPDRRPTDDGVVAGGWWHTEDAPHADEQRIICDLCPRECHLKPGDRGFCFVRENRDGEMALTTYGRSTGFCIDPIEKKPLNHFYPGTSVLSFGTAGCNLGCKFCQNWDISKSREVERLSELATPESIAAAAQQLGCRSVAFTYNDPVIWAEYAIDTARACREAGVRTVAVTAGYITPVARPAFYEFIDAANVDLKAFTEEFYYSLTSSHLQPVLDTIRWLRYESDVWFELTNLIIPQANDSDDELARMSNWVLEELGDEVPVHFTAFHPDFRMQDRPATPHETLLRAYEVARREGLKYVYVGNVHDVKHQSTFCGNCGELLIERDWHQLGTYALEKDCCGHCGHSIPGRFEEGCGDWGRRRLPVNMAHFRNTLPQIDASRLQSPAQTSQVAEPESSAESQPPTTERRSAMTESQATNAPGTKISGEPDLATATIGACPELTDPQRQAIFRSACEVIEAQTRGQQVSLSDPTMSGADQLTVMGAFVTAKRRGRLRACCGVLGRPMRLADTVLQAAARTATEDQRMPPITPAELPYLDIDVTLLHSFRSVPLTGDDGRQRLESIEVGRHGLQIQRGQQSGLLLPSVAVEHELDAEAFLRHVCQKAGLPTTAWQQPETQLVAFEAVEIDGDEGFSAAEGEAERTLLSQDELTTLAHHCARNILAHLQGATPSYYLPNCPDANVQGLALTMRLGESAPMILHRFSLRPPMPMQSTLFSLTEAAANALRQQRTTGSVQLQVGLAILYDAAMHGNVSDPDIRGVDTARRGLLMVENAKRGWRFDPESSAEQLLSETVKSLDVRLPDSTSIFSLAIQTTEPRLIVNAVPQATAGPEVRPPAVAGAFYPADPDELNTLVGQLLEATRPETPPRPAPAAMVPHAGLVYSGRVAAAVYNRIEIPPTVIVLSPKHTRLGVEWSVAPHARWQIPGGQLESDPELARRLADAIPGLQLDAAAHQNEHGIEVELPFLAHLAPNTRVVGITLGAGNLERCREFAQGLAGVLETLDPQPLLLISSDMNHFATDDENRKLDELALQALETLDASKLYETVSRHQISMCGVLPAVVVLETLHALGRLNRCERVDYATSADTTGDKSRVVGYAGMLF